MFTKMKVALVICGSLVAGVAGIAGAQGFAHDRGQMIQKYDTNKDGKLDDSEKAAMKADFNAKRAEKKSEMLGKYDTNKDGKLDPSERAVARDDRMTAMFKKLDTDGNGQISLAEFKAGKQARVGGMHHRGRGGHRGGFGHGRGNGTK